MGSPRIISGKARGIRLKSVPGNITRPVTDRVKEALFNIIAAKIIDAVFLDAFGGTGSVGIEALSRGAKEVLFLDNKRQAVEVIKENLEKTKLSDKAKVRLADALSYLRQLPDKQYDFIYIAPPQYKGIWKQVLEIIDANTGWLSANCWVIVQVDPVEYEKITLNSMVEINQRRYGSTLLLFFEQIG